MYIESVPNRSSPPAILLRESFRVGGRVKKRTLANLSKLPANAIEALRRIRRGERLVNPDDAFSCVRSLPHGHVAAVLGALKRLGLHTLLARGASRAGDLVLALLVARVIDPQSKLATARALTPESAVSTLGESLANELRRIQRAGPVWGVLVDAPPSPAATPAQSHPPDRAGS